MQKTAIGRSRDTLVGVQQLAYMPNIWMALSCTYVTYSFKTSNFEWKTYAGSWGVWGWTSCPLIFLGCERNGLLSLFMTLGKKLSKTYCSTCRHHNKPHFLESVYSEILEKIFYVSNWMYIKSLNCHNKLQEVSCLPN